MDKHIIMCPLHAAAPDLLAALNAMLAASGNVYELPWEQVREAIKKATQ